MRSENVLSTIFLPNPSSYAKKYKIMIQTDNPIPRMYSSRMRTARCGGHQWLCFGGWVYIPLSLHPLSMPKAPFTLILCVSAATTLMLQINFGLKPISKRLSAFINVKAGAILLATLSATFSVNGP